MRERFCSMVKWPNRHPGPDGDPSAWPEAADTKRGSSIAATETGDANARDGATAVSGYTGPGPGTTGPVDVSHTGAATASGGSLANTGYLAIGTFVQQAAPRTPAAWPHQVGVLPPRALSFQHRAEVDQLRTAVVSGGTAVLNQVLTGTGGVGKTQLAADYARTAWDSDSVDVLVWINATSQLAITDGYAQAGVEVLGADPKDPERAAREFLAWLEPKAAPKPCRWLVVLDDLADPADLRGLWPPNSPRGRTLVTTRRREAALIGAGRRMVHVGLFMPWESAAYLTEVLAARGRTEPTEQINGLAADLGHLPLALAQAAAYLVDTNLACADYRELLADRMRKLASLLPEPGVLPDDQATTVAATWSLSIERANQIRPAGLARPMLQVAAMLDPNGIPNSVLTSEPALVYLDINRGFEGWDSDQEVTVEDAVGTLRALHRLSLINHTPDAPHQAVRVHQLIQRATRDELPSTQRGRVARAAANALTAAWPAIERDTALAQALRANTDALTRHAEDALCQASGTHAVFFRTGRSLGESGLVTAALEHFERLAGTTHRALGPDHLHTLTARSDLAWWQGEAGDVPGAVAAYTELLEQTQRVLGPDDPHTVGIRSNLAAWRGEAAIRLHPAHFRGVAGDVAGDVVGAVAAYTEVLAQQERVLGPDHPDTLITLHDLAKLRGRQGMWREL
ncbi:tetratricopeptide repeat protein [Streptomyces sanglieri]|uniref:Tetratricopeptide repeat protein n=1 Tax=Streptomyces sanglieri TaxID=193460 RepID=A0ABW2WRD7_9ACTN